MNMNTDLQNPKKKEVGRVVCKVVAPKPTLLLPAKFTFTTPTQKFHKSFPRISR